MKHINLFYSFFLILFLLRLSPANAQTALCNGSLGNPVVNIDFGRGGPQSGPAISETNLQYLASGTPSDGWYSIGKTTTGMHSSTWHQIANHTPNDPTGYMMIVNASYDASTFYESTVPNLCANTTYEFAAWIINLLRYNGIKPNLTFTIISGGSILAEINTGDIPETAVPTWIQHGVKFSTGSDVTDLSIRIVNNGDGGNGNDIAIDDITFRPCGAEITPVIDSELSQQKTLCVGSDEIVTFSARISPGVYSTPGYLWQQIDDRGFWQDLQTQRTDHFSQSFAGLPAGTYKYRLLVAEANNINFENCRAISPEYTVTLMPKPVPIVAPVITVCVGQPINLTVSEASSYDWSGPGFSSTDRSPVINNADFGSSGIYQVKVTNAMGCEATAEIAVTVLPVPVAAIQPVARICKGSQVSLIASGGSVYRWFPGTDLSNPNIPNPIARPSVTTTYTVTVSNGACESTSNVTVVVDGAFASAGPDKVIIEGQQVVLQGTVSDQANFYWSPAEGLDDQFKLNPVATPNSDVTYTLNVLSALGCRQAVDKMSIKVYKKLIVPNTFSPNGDSVNDLWNITAIRAYPNAKVKIVNRYGKLIFESFGYQSPWDGRYENREVPAGVYYYLIDLDSGLPALSGSLMVIR